MIIIKLFLNYRVRVIFRVILFISGTYLETSDNDVDNSTITNSTEASDQSNDTNESVTEAPGPPTTTWPNTCICPEEEITFNSTDNNRYSSLDMLKYNRFYSTPNYISSKLLQECIPTQKI